MCQNKQNFKDSQKVPKNNKTFYPTCTKQPFLINFLKIFGKLLLKKLNK